MGYGGLVLAVLVAGVVMVTSAQKESTALWNNLVDVVLGHARDEQLKRGRQELELKDVDRDFERKFAFIKLRGNIKAEGGWLKDVTTAHRVGDVLAERVGSTLKVTGTVSWSELSLGYRHYRLDVRRVIEGDLQVSARSNAVRAVFAFEMVDGRCMTRVEELRILDLSNLDVKIRGLGFLNFLTEFLVKWFVDTRKDDITSKLEEMFKEAIPEHLESFECDEYASLLMVPI